jgi:DNA-binding transcriptional ArsR family regulator
VSTLDDIVVPEVLAELFSSKVRAAVLALLLPRPHIGFSLTELSRRLGLPVSSLQHECYKLARLGLLRDERVGNARRYRPDPAFPLLDPLTTLTLSALPLPIALQGAAEQVPGLEDAWVAGNLDADGPIYLVVLGDLELEAIDGVFERARKALMPTVEANRIELAYYRTMDWRVRQNGADPFVAALERDRLLDLLPIVAGCADSSASQT